MFYNAEENTRHHGVINLAMQTSMVDQLHPCPCGRKPELANTHTASYWLECECGLELHDVKATGEGKTMRAHRASAKRVVTLWQTFFDPQRKTR